MSSPAYCRPAAFQEFLRGVAGLPDPAALCRAAVAIASHAQPESAFDDVQRQLDRLADEVRRRVRSDSDEARLAHLHDVLFDVAGFRGAVDDYYHPRNSYLPDVLRTKRGIPISLVLVYHLVGERIGLTVEGVNAPGHFLAAVDCREANGRRTLYVDPFYSGALLTEAEAYERLAAAVGAEIEPDPAMLRRATPLAWLSRMLLNLQAIFAREGNQRDLYAMLEMQAVVSNQAR